MNGYRSHLLCRPVSVTMLKKRRVARKGDGDLRVLRKIYLTWKGYVVGACSTRETTDCRGCTAEINFFSRLCAARPAIPHQAHRRERPRAAGIRRPADRISF